MQALVKNRGALIGCRIALLMLVTANAQAIGSFDGRATKRPSIGNFQPRQEVWDSVTHKGYVNRSSGDHIAITNNPKVSPAKLVGRRNKKDGGFDVLDGLFFVDARIELLLNTPASFYGDDLNLAVSDGIADAGANNLFHFDGVVPDMPSSKVTTEGYLDVSPVPLPAAAWSFLLGLLGILGLKKRKSPPDETV